MSTDEKTAEADGLWSATLVRGRFYAYAGKEFLRDEPQTVDTATKEYLEESAFDTVTLEDEGETQKRPKFRFAPAGEKAASPAPAGTRVRTRSAG